MQIQVDDDVYAELKRQAEPFVDTPNSVLRRLLGLEDGARQHAQEVDAIRRPQTARHDRASRAPAAPVKKRKRAPAGALLPESEYELPVLRALEGAGGRAPAREVIAAVGEQLADRLTDLDREIQQSGAARWQGRVQFTRLRMVDSGLLKKGSPRGTWEISEVGRRRLAEEAVSG